MKGDRIYYKAGYKYQLARDYMVEIPIKGIHAVTEWIQLERDGKLYIRKGYAWDGPSGPTFDTPDSMRGSLVHDALYQLMRLGLLDKSFRAKADDILHDICVEDGMIHMRAELWEEMVSLFAGPCIAREAEPEILEAP